MNKKSLKWRMPLIAAIVAACLFYAYPPLDPDGSGPGQGKLKLGLDLQGGMQLVLRVDTSKLSEDARQDATLRAIEVIRNRIDQFGVSEPSIQQQGEDRIMLQLPGISDRERALELIGRTALLEFKLVDSDATHLKDALAGKVPVGYKLYKSEDKTEGDLLLKEEAVLSGKYIVNAKVDVGEYSDWLVDLEFNAEGARLFSDLTSENVGKKLAIVLDNKVQSAPVINERIPSGRAQISGSFNVDQAGDLAIVLRAGALPAPIIIEEERSVGPSLGKDSVQRGVKAMLTGFAMVVVFMMVYYLFAGLVANVALLLNILIILAAMSYFHATLTLPGIAGIVLTIGMAVDTNVLIFERIREELALKKAISSSIVTGYQKAFITILDSNLTTLITAAVLYQIGSGPVRGFALTLAIGIIASMFTGIFVTRSIFDALLFSGRLKTLPMLQFLKRTPQVNYLKFRKICYVVSLVIVLIGVFSFVKRGPTLFGVDFSGGSMQEYRFQSPVAIEKLRKSLDEIGYGTATLQRVGETNQIIVRSPLNSEKPIAEKIKKDFPDNSFEMLRLESVGPVVGKELKGRAIWAFVLSLAAIWLYVVYRFNQRYAFGAILALFHDGLVALGFVALTGRELSITVLAAVLTILGYSINDTIVIFDRIRERRRSGHKETFEEAINVSVNQTMSRTILTSFTVLIVVTALYIYGGNVINDFAFTMLIGLVSGTYSTVYIAAPVLVDWPGSKKH